MNKQISLLIIVAVIVGGISFYGGTRYQQSKSFGDRGGRQFQGMAGSGGFAARGGQGMMRGAGLVSGEVLSADDKSLTVKLRDGGSKIVFFSTSTDVQKTVDGGMSDLTTGKWITVTGASNSDGSITAQSVQVRQAPPVVRPARN